MGFDSVLIQYRFPAPLAVSHMRRGRALGSLGRLAAELTLESDLLRITALIAIADYLSDDARAPEVSNLLHQATREDAISWLALLDKLGSFLSTRETPSVVPQISHLMDQEVSPGLSVRDYLAGSLTLTAELAEARAPWCEQDCQRHLEAREAGHQGLLAVADFFGEYVIAGLAGSDDEPPVCINRFRGPYTELALLPRGHDFLPPADRPFLITPDGARALSLYPLLQIAGRGTADDEEQSLALLAAIPTDSGDTLARYSIPAFLEYQPLPVRDSHGDSVPIGDVLLRAIERPGTSNHGGEPWFLLRDIPPPQRSAWAGLTPHPSAELLRQQNIEIIAPHPSASGCLALRARDRRHEREIVVQPFCAPPLAMYNDLPQIARRIRARMQIEHPVLVRHHSLEASADDHSLILFSEATDGGAAEDEIRDGTRSTQRALDVTIDLLRALEALHDLGYVHGAVTADCVRFTEDGFTKLADSFSAGCAPGGGSPADDQYAAASLLYRLLTGKCPAAVNPRPPSHHKGDTDDDYEVASLDAIVMRALRANPAARFAQVRDFRAALEGLRETLPEAQRLPFPRTVSYLRFATEDIWFRRVDSLSNAGNWSDLLLLHLERLRVEANAERQGRLIAAAATIAEEGLQDRSLSIRFWIRVLKTLPNDKRALDSLERLAALEERSHALVALLHQQLEALPVGSEARVGLHLRLARLHALEPAGEERAVYHWRAVLARQPKNRKALDGLFALCLRPTALPSLAPILPELHKWAEKRDPGDWLLVSERLLELWSSSEYDSKRCLALANESLAKEPRFAPALAVLARHHKLMEDWSGASLYLEKLLELETGSESRGLLHIEIANILEHRLRRPEEAFSHLARALSDHPQPALRMRLITLAAKLADHAELARLLREHIAATEKGSPAVANLQLQLADTLAHALEKPDEALDLLTVAVRENPRHPGLRFALWELCREAGAHELFCDVVGEICEALEPAVRADYLVRAAERAWFALEDPERTYRLSLAALRERPTNRLVLMLITESCKALGRTEELIDALQKSAALDPSPDAELLCRMQIARIHEVNQDLERALEHLVVARDLAPDNAELLLMLDRILSALDRPAEQRGVLAALKGRYPGGEARRLLAIAGLQRRPPIDREGALATAREALAAAIRQEEPELQRAALMFLAELYRDAHEWPSLAEVLEQLAPRLALPLERAEVWAELAEVARVRLEDPARTIASHLQVLNHTEDALRSGDDTGAIVELRRAAIKALLEWTARHDNWAARAEALAAAAAQPQSPAERQSLLLERAELFYDRLGSPEQAITSLEQLLGEAHDPAAVLVRLARWHRERGNFAAEEGVLTHLIECEQDPTRRAASLVRLGALAEQLGRAPANVLAPLEQAVACCPESDEAHEALTSKLAEHLGSTATEPAAAALRHALSHWAATSRSRTARATAYTRLAELHLALKDNEAGLNALSRALDEDPRHLPAVRLLLPLRLSEERYSESLALIELELDLATDLEPRDTAALQRLAGLMAARIGDPTAALGFYSRALALDPGDPESLLGKAQALLVLERDEEARVELERLAARPAAGLPPRVLLETRRDLEEIERRREQRVLSVTRLEQELSDHPADKASLERALVLYEELSEWRKAADTHHRLAEISTEREVRLEHLVAAAEIEAQRLSDHDSAVESYREALGCAPDSPALLAALLEAESAAGDYGGAVRTIATLRSLSDDPRRRAALEHKLARINRDHLGRPRDAIAHLEAALECDPDHSQAFADLDALLADQDDQDARVALHERMLDHLADGDDTAASSRLYYALGRILAPSRPKEAIRALEAALERAPELPAARRLLAQMLETTPGSLPRAVAEHRRLTKLSPRDPEPYRALRRVFSKLESFDAAWCAASVLVLIDAADERETTLFKRFQTPELRVQVSALTSEDWELVLAPVGEDGVLGEVMGFMRDEFASLLTEEQSHLLDTGGEEIAREESNSAFFKILSAISRLFGSAPPLVQPRPESYGVRPTGLARAALAVGRDTLTSGRGKRLRFELARALAWHHPRLCLGASLPRATLERMLDLAVRVTYPESTDIRADERTRELLAKLRGGLDPEGRRRLELLVRRLRERGDQRELVARWRARGQVCALRAGLLLANDITVAAECIREARWSADLLPLEEQLDQLKVFMVSEEYLRLRARLGIRIN